jgi:hypothetical protein
MATLANLTDEVLLNLEGFGALQDTVAQVTVGSANVTTGYTDVTLTSPQITSGSGITPSVIEVQDELMYVANATFTASPASLTCQVLRGWRGTTQATPSTPDHARLNPRFPRAAVKRAINDTIAGLYPRLFVIKTTEINYQANRATYDLPADARNVIAVTVQHNPSSPDWSASRYWRMDNQGGSGSATGKVISVRDGNPGRKIRVTYTAEPATLPANSSDFAAISGLPDWVREVVVYGACWRLVSFADASNAFSTSAEQRLINDNQQGGQSKSQSLARYFLGMFETRLAEAEGRMQDLYPAPRHYIR